MGPASNAAELDRLPTPGCRWHRSWIDQAAGDASYVACGRGVIGEASAPAAVLIRPDRRISQAAKRQAPSPEMDKEWMTSGAVREVANSVLSRRQLFPGTEAPCSGQQTVTD